MRRTFHQQHGASAKIGAAAKRRAAECEACFIDMDSDGKGPFQREFWRKIPIVDQMAYAADLIERKRITNVTDFTTFAPKVIQELVLPSNKRRRELGLPEIQPQKSRSRADC
ncbi:MAG: hypothetical protein PHF60_05080 [Candidatus ainarchaeum sp.]|nr:hypothetical protein [Candidatus ainarchaeum sp.]